MYRVLVIPECRTLKRFQLGFTELAAFYTTSTELNNHLIGI